VQSGEVRHLSSDCFQTLTDLPVDGLPMRIEGFA
jgi:hypothetical protein